MLSLAATDYRRARAAGTALATIVVGAFLSKAALAADAIELLDRGVQIYTCTAAGDAFSWHFKAPDAALLTATGQDAGHHFAGPSWQAKDGGTVVGEVVATSNGVTGAIPWLVLRAKSHTGTGAFASVAYIVRSRTAGGVAPSGGCDKDHAGAEARADYTATYTFFPATDMAKP